VERARATWTDERLDDMAQHVNSGIGRLDADIRALHAEVHSEVALLRTELGGRIDGLQRTMLQVGVGIIATMVVGFASILAAQLA
jgi:hypothetical protein